MTFKYLYFSILCLLNVGVLSANIKLPAIFSDNMVLQQQSQVSLWGISEFGKTIKITTSWDKKTSIVQTDAEGKWKVKIETPKAGGPYEILLSDGTSLVLKNILIGEVWLCSGQSNMDIPMRGVGEKVKIKDAAFYIKSANNSQLRLFKVDHAKSDFPLTDVQGSWKETDSASVARFSAVGYLFGKELQEKLGVPVGIIKSAVGGTAIAAWMSEELLRESFGIAKGTKAGQANASELFNAMIAPLAGYGIKGMLWYQGEANHGNAGNYAKLLPAMVREWRGLWNIGTPSFYYAQIAPYNYKDGKSPFMRQVQAECMKTISNSGMVSLTDAGEEDNIHPQDKKVVAERFVNWALAKDYGYKVGYCGPVFNSFKVAKNTIEVKFDYAENGLTSKGTDLVNFEIAGPDSVFVPAKAKISGTQTVTVWSDDISSPVAVRYAFKDFVQGDLFNNYGLPASTFQAFK